MNIYKSAKGFLCAAKNGKNIHSQYNPEREAERFIQASQIVKPSIIILLGAGLGYIQREIQNKYPHSQIFAIYYDDELYKNRLLIDPSVKCWYPSSEISINAFFSRYITEEKLRNLSLLEWNPSSLIFPDDSFRINRILKKSIQQLNGNIKTTALFGKKWMRNMISNYLSINNYCTFIQKSLPIVIVSSGPTLEKSLSQISRFQNKILIWALPSSLTALNHANIRPDLLISTDPGYYGKFHFTNLPQDIPVAIPLTGSRGLWTGGNPVVTLNQSFPFENDLFNISKMKNIPIPSNGTVSGTALELALKYSDNIYFAGLDLCFRDIQSHIKPHSFDSLLGSETNRSSPLQSVFYHRASLAEPDFSLGIRTSRSLDTYRNWFTSRNTESSKIIKRLNPSPIHIDNIGRGDLSELIDFPLIDKKQVKLIDIEPKNIRIKNIQKLFSQWEAELEEKKRDDLLYFIDTDAYTKGISDHKVLSFISELRRRYG